LREGAIRLRAASLARPKTTTEEHLASGTAVAWPEAMGLHLATLHHGRLDASEDEGRMTAFAVGVLLGIQVVAAVLAGASAPPEVEPPAWVGIGVLFVAAYYLGAMLFAHALDRIAQALLHRSAERLGYTLCGLGVVAGLIVFRGGLLGELFGLLAASSIVFVLIFGAGMLLLAGLGRRAGSKA